MRIYSLFDKKSLSYGPVMSFPNDVTAIRAIEMEMKNSKSVVSNYPTDFALMHLGNYDDAKGILEPLSCPLNVYECANFFTVAENNQ